MQLSFFLIDPVDEAKEDSDKFTKDINTFSPQLNGSLPYSEFGSANVFNIKVLLKEDTANHKMEPN